MSEIGWDELEATVDRAVARLTALGEENEQLRRQVEELEARLEAMTGAADSRWAEERAEVARRVDRLVAKLNGLTESAS